MIHVRCSLALACGALLLASCSSVQVRTDYDPQADFSRLRTFAWASPVQEKTGDLRIDSPLLDERIRRAVESTLQARGFEKAAPRTADFVVAYHLSLEQRLDVRTMDSYYGYRRYGAWGYGGTQTTVSQYEQGTLIIDVADARAQRLVWRGSGSRRVSQSSDPEKATENVNRAVQEILAKFPPTRQGGDST